MMLQLPFEQATGRRVARPAMVLLIVITMLMIFAVVGLAFVQYAEIQATASAGYKDAEARSIADVDPEAALALFLGKMIYDEPDTASGCYSALRGHGLVRGVYGLDYELDNSTNPPSMVLRNRTGPYTGTGRLHYLLGANAGVLSGTDDYEAINYTAFPGGPVRDPERVGIRSSVADTAYGTPTGGTNVPYTYPDLHSFYLGAVRADGTVITPSFHREYLFGRLDDYSNPNWTSAKGKYLTLRPRPGDHSGFPFPEDRYGDVRNLPGQGGNDSIWIDIDAPVMVAPDGRKYKMLFAPLIIDMDGRINLNYAGSISGKSNQGWGRWEINLAKLAGGSWSPLFVGDKTLQQPGRYGFGAGGQPAPHGAAPAGPVGSWYSKTDYDASAGTAATQPVIATTANPTVSAFPTFPGGYDNSSGVEMANHPAGYNFLTASKVPAAPSVTDLGDRRFAPSNMEALLRFRDKGSPALTSELIRLLPAQFAVARLRGMVTTQSFDFDLPGVTSYVFDPTAGGYTYAAANGFPLATASMPFPSPVTQRTATPVGSEFDAGTWRALSAAIGRVNLNRPLTDYPPPDPTSGLVPAGLVTQWTQATTDRQALARDLYNALIVATGVRDPNATKDPNGRVYPLGATAAEINTARWMAQLAVNIVDFIDKDDYMTPFQWWSQNTPQSPGDWVFGTELPRLVINEMYAQYDNDPDDPTINVGAGTVKKASYFRVNTWIELYNPFFSTPVNRWDSTATQFDTGTAVLQYPGHSPYQVVVTRNFTDNRNYLAGLTNTTGAPNPAGTVSTGETNTLYTVNSFGTTAGTQTILPSSGAYAGAVNGNSGFYVLGPNTKFMDGRDPKLPVTITSDQLSMKVPTSPLPTDPTTGRTLRPTVYLQRLACPNRLPNTTPGPDYNPYITVDYRESEALHDGHVVSSGGGGSVAAPAITTWASDGRVQPYAGLRAMWRPQNPSDFDASKGQPMHTFYRHNGQEPAVPLNQTGAQTLQQPFDWLVHLDRQLISPMELLHVSSYRPTDLTHKFVSGTVAAPVKFQHYAQWLNDNTRLSRFLEFVTTGDRGAGMANRVRIPGKVNINTIWEQEIWDAICDHPLSASLYYDSTNNVGLVPSRSPGLPTNTINPTDHHRSGVTVDRPFRSLATGYTAAAAVDANGGQYPNDTGIGNTLLRPQATGSGPTAQRLFDVPATHPYDQKALLTKIFNHLTVRSNVFAVFVTVGFFEVVDDSTRPVRLGAEFNRSENRHVRHRMFAIVDRTAVSTSFYVQNPDVNSVQAGNPGFLRAVVTLKNPVTVTPGSPPVSGTLDMPPDKLYTVTGTRVQFTVGSRLTLDANTPNEETVVVTAVDPTNTILTVAFSKSHAGGAPGQGATITIRGNPGPWLNYNPRRDTGVVPYFSIID
jgi:hypothetical protein